MMRRALAKAFLFGMVCGPAFAADPLPALQETPMFADQVKAGRLPPVARRIPQQPLVVRTFAGDDGPGRQGGQLTMLVTGTRDTVLMTIYSYARLIVYDGRFKLQPDILESYEAKEDREFTFKLRAGHKWSDGHPFTTEDFRFFWEDIANNKRALAVWSCRPNFWSMASHPESRSSTSVPSSIAGTGPIPTLSKARRAPPRSFCSRRLIT